MLDKFACPPLIAQATGSSGWLLGGLLPAAVNGRLSTFRSFENLRINTTYHRDRVVIPIPLRLLLPRSDPGICFPQDQLLRPRAKPHHRAFLPTQGFPAKGTRRASRYV